MNSQLPFFEYFSAKIEGVKIFQYNQIKSLLSNLLCTQTLRTSLTNFETLLISRSIYKKTLSKIYSLLVEEGKCDMGSLRRWEYDLQQQIDEAEWIKSNAYITDISCNSAIR